MKSTGSETALQSDRIRVPPPTKGSDVPLLSVVIPAYKSAWSIFETLGSLSESQIPLEVIVVENGSGELRTTDLQQALGAHKLTLIRLAASDLSTARNRGFEEAAGEWVMFLDSDDVVDSVGITATLNEIVDTDVNAVVVGQKNFAHSQDSEFSRAADDNREHFGARCGTGKVSKSLTFLLGAFLKSQYSPVTGRYVFRTSLLERTGFLFPAGFLHEDHAFIFRNLFESGSVLESLSVMFFKRESPRSLGKSISPEVSLEGYRKAIVDLRSWRSKKPESLAARVSSRWIITRLEAIEAKKSLSSGNLGLAKKASLVPRLVFHGGVYTLTALVGAMIFAVSQTKQLWSRD